MAVDECCGSVVFTEQAAVDVVKAVPGDETIPAGGTCETLHRDIEETFQNITLHLSYMLLCTDT